MRTVRPIDPTQFPIHSPLSETVQSEILAGIWFQSTEAPTVPSLRSVRVPLLTLKYDAGAPPPVVQPAA